MRLQSLWCHTIGHNCKCGFHKLISTYLTTNYLNISWLRIWRDFDIYWLHIMLGKKMENIYLGLLLKIVFLYHAYKLVFSYSRNSKQLFGQKILKNREKIAISQPSFFCLTNSSKPKIYQKKTKRSIKFSQFSNWMLKCLVLMLKNDLKCFYYLILFSLLI